MPTTALTHHECRSKVCRLCGQKGSKKSMVTIVKGDINFTRIQQLYPDFLYDPEDQFEANGLCGRDRNLLRDLVNGKVAIEKKPDLPCYSDLDFGGKCGDDLRDLIDCTCHFCSIAKVHAGISGPTPKKVPFAVGRPLLTPPPPPKKSAMTCLTCKQVIGRGISHKCTQTTRRRNLEKSLDEDPDHLEILASREVRKKVAQASASSSNIELKTGHGGGKTLSIANPKAGTSTAVHADEPIPAETWWQICNAANLTQNQQFSIAADLRTVKGRKFFESSMKDKLAELNSQLKPFYKSVEIEIDSSNRDELLNENGKVKRPIFYVDDLQGLINFIVAKRGYDPSNELLFKVGIDKGGTFLKVCLTIQETWEGHTARYWRRRANYRDGPRANRFKDSGVKKIIPVAFIEDATESYENLETIINLVGLNKIPYIPAFDMKCGLCFLGLGTAASKHSCMWCDMDRDDFGKPEFICKGGNLRTFSNIEKYSTSYQEAAAAHTGAGKLSSKKFLNAEHKSLFDPEDLDQDSFTVHSIPPMELHILLGLGNNLFKLLEATFLSLGCSYFLSNWLNPLGVAKAARHGGQFNGNQLVKVLQHLFKLRRSLRFSEVLKEVQPLLKAMEALDSVRKACFSQTLDEDFESKIHALAECWLELGIKVTPKAHALFVHVAQFLNFQNKDQAVKRGLGFWSEQASESVHSDFQKFWLGGCYKREFGAADYVEKTLECIIKYASKHI